MIKLRQHIKAMMPKGARAKIRALLTPPGVETVALRDYHFSADPTDTPRLSLIIPSLSKGEAFGGVMTGLQYYLALAAGVKAATGADIRVITEEAYDPGDSVLAGQIKAAGLAEADVEVMSLAANGQKLPLRARDMVMAYNWWISLNMEPALKAQAAHFAMPPLPKLYIIQEYEPQFYPFSSAHMLALHAFNSDYPLWAVFNSSELARYYEAQGNSCEKSYFFEPRMAPAIRAFQDGLTAAEKTRTILVYGRPTIPRNCFSILETGLRHWAEASKGAPGWRVVSAGMKHRDVDLGHGQKIVSLGKLSLDGYGQLLRETAIGVSLMSSPHPSYPPLEMAHFGIRTITNRYPGKDLTRRHDNIVSLKDVLPATLGTTLTETVAAFESDPGGGLNGASHMADYLTDLPFECLDEMTRDVIGALTR